MKNEKLHEKMIEERYSQRSLAKKIGMPVAVMNSRINGRTDWRITEALVISKLLDIKYNQIVEFFVPEMSTSDDTYFSYF